MSDMGCYCYCGDYNGEMPTFYRQSFHKARKKHQCCECKDVIKKGERYKKVVGMWDERIETYCFCLSCDDARTEVWQKLGINPPFGEVGCCYVRMLYEESKG